MLLSFGVKAQDHQTGVKAVAKGATVEYSVAEVAGSTFTWKVQKHNGTAYVDISAGVDFDETNVGSPKSGKSITWKTVGTYRIVMVETTHGSCDGQENYLNVEVKNNVDIAKYIITYNSDYCASEQVTKGGIKVLIETTATLKYPLKLRYTIKLGTGATSAEKELEIGTSGTEFPEIAEIKTAVIDAGSGVYGVTFTVVSVKDGYGALIPAKDGNVKAITINQNPAPRTILHN